MNDTEVVLDITFCDPGYKSDSISVLCMSDMVSVGDACNSEEWPEEALSGCKISLNLDERLVETFSNAAAFLQRKLNESRKLNKRAIARKAIEVYASEAFARMSYDCEDNEIDGMLEE